MSIRVLLFSFLTVMSVYLNAQTEAGDSNFRFGLTGGSHYSMMLSFNDLDLDVLHGPGSYMAGVYAKARLKGPLFIRVEMLRTERRVQGPYPFKYLEPVSSIAGKASIQAQVTDGFWELPVLFEYFASDNISAYMGAHLAQRVQTSVTLDEAELSAFKEDVGGWVTAVIPEERNWIELGYVLGGQVMVNDYLAFGGRLTRMFSRAFEGSEAPALRYSFFQVYANIELN